MSIKLLNMEQVGSLIDMDEVIEVTKRVLIEKAREQTQMPPKVYVFFAAYKGDFRVMPAYIPMEEAAGVKIVNVHPDNHKHNLPTVMATIVLLDPKTGEPISIMDGTLLTSIRTGAAGAVAAEHLARKDVRKVAFIGGGTQAKQQLLGLLSVYGNRFSAKVYDPSSEAIKRLISLAKGKGVDLSEESNVRSCIRDADIIVTTTPSTKPVVEDGWVQEGVHINAMGADAPGKEELDPKLLKRSKIFVDDIEQATHSGEINVPISKGLMDRHDIAGELGEVLDGRVKGRQSDKDITVFDSTGLAIQDIAVAHLAYESAVKKGVGSLINLI